MVGWGHHHWLSTSRARLTFVFAHVCTPRRDHFPAASVVSVRGRVQCLWWAGFSYAAIFHGLRLWTPTFRVCPDVATPPPSFRLDAASELISSARG